MHDSWYVEYMERVPDKDNECEGHLTPACGMDSIMWLDGRLTLRNMVRKAVEAGRLWTRNGYDGFRIVRGYGGGMKVLTVPLTMRGTIDLSS